ncbi:MAG: DMT family transporter [Rhodobacterales bacterium]
MTAPVSNTLKAVFWMMGAVVSFSAMAVAGREMSVALDTFEIMTYRSLIGLAIIVVIGLSTGKTRAFRTDRIGLNFVRNIFHFTGQNLWFFAVTVIPLAHLFAFEFSVPIWVTLAAPFLLHERLNSLRVMAVFIGFAGILMVTRPWVAGLSIGIAAAALSAICFAGTSIATKRLTDTQSTLSILFWMTAMQLVFGLICAGYDGDIALPTYATLHWVIIVGLGGLLAHFCVTTALSLAPATVVLPIDFTRLPLIALIGWQFYNESLDIWVILGAAIIFGSNYVNIWAGTRAQSEPALNN